MAVLMYNSGRTASCIQAANFGMKLPTNSPASSATMNPASGVSRSDHEMPKVLNCAGVLAAMLAQLPTIQEI